MAAKSEVKRMQKTDGTYSDDRKEWPELIAAFYTKLFGDEKGEKGQEQLMKELREKAEKAGKCSIKLPLEVLMKAKSRMNENKTGGKDGAVAEMLKLLSFKAMAKIRYIFEEAFNDLSTRLDVPFWEQLHLHCIPKTKQAEKYSSGDL